jgi:hypothetical protein
MVAVLRISSGNLAIDRLDISANFIPSEIAEHKSLSVL